jgi:hypothetical protein
MSEPLSIHFCHPWSGDCAMRGLRINLATPWAFIIVGFFGGQVQRRRPDGTYGHEWTHLSVDRTWSRRRRRGPERRLTR